MKDPADPTTERPPRFLEVYSSVNPLEIPSKQILEDMDSRVRIVLSRGGIDSQSSTSERPQEGLWETFLSR